MQTLQIDEKNARKLFHTASKEFKQMLTDTFGEKLFSEKIGDRVQTLADVMEIAGITSDQLYAGCEDDQERGNREAKLISKVYNNGDVLDPMNTNQNKYFPWFDITPKSGFGLSHGYAYWGSNACVGVRLCFVRRDDAIDAGKNFPEVYSKLLIK